MQLEAGARSSPLRRRLGAAACLLLTTGRPAAAQAPDTTSNQLEVSALLYGERQRTDVVEPTARITHLFGNGQALAITAGLDVMTGASPTGATPSNRVQTTTSASGGGSSSSSGSAVPTARFSDRRGVVDLGWQSPISRWARSETGAHWSREKDYRSLGWNQRFTLDLIRHLATVTVGGGLDRDQVLPVGGTPLGLSNGRAIASDAPQDKRVNTLTAGFSGVLTRRWLVAFDASRTQERGYLNEPYKIVTVQSGAAEPGDDPSSSTVIAENRPATRDRKSLLGSSVYHLDRDVLYLSYRYYWDDWDVRSHTVDARYRIERSHESFIQPHARFYTQTPARFFTYGLPGQARLPAYASSDERLGPLHGLTLGATYGFRAPPFPGEFTLRAEWIRQWGDGAQLEDPNGPIDLFPALDIGTAVFGYTLGF